MTSIRDFVPLTKLGEGSFSTVYKVRRLSDQKIYAIKKVRMNNLSQKEKENALNEIRILASFDCENIVAYKEAFFDDKLNVLCIVMEYADRGDLHHYIDNIKKNYQAVPEITIWKCAADILLAIDHLHSKGILHRDLKSANIFIHENEYKLGDLNVSKVNGGKLAYTQTGTPYYASPEVWRDEPYDNKSDLWSFGCILYELACLRPPFSGKDMDELFKNVQKCSHPPIPQEYSLELADLIDQCLQKNPKNRPKASELLNHKVICRFRNRKNIPIDENETKKELLRTIKLPCDLRSLKMNLPESKYDEKKSDLVKSPKQRNEEKLNAKNFASDRPMYQNRSEVIAPSSNNPSILKNQSHLIEKMQIIKSPRANNNEPAYLSPRNIKKLYENYALNRSPEDSIPKKIASGHASASEKKSINISQDSTDRKYRIDQNYSDRRISSQKKSIITEKYEQFIKQELEKKPSGIPRTEKRIQSSENENNFCEIPESSFVEEKKDVSEWKRGLVKKRRVFSNNIFGNRPAYNNEMR